MATYHEYDSRHVDWAQVGDPVKLKVPKPVIRQCDCEPHDCRNDRRNPRPLFTAPYAVPGQGTHSDTRRGDEAADR